MIIRKTTVLFCVMALCAVLASCATKADPTVIKIEPVKEYDDEKTGVHIRTLPDGMRVVALENHAAPVVTVRLIVNTGSMDEGENLGCGMSHLVEHVMAGGTTLHRTEDENKEMIKAIGAGANAETFYYYTAYYMTTTSRYFDQALDMISDYIMYCTFDPEQVAREFGVISQEIAKGEEEPNRILSQLFNSTAYDASNVRIPIIGYRERFLRLNREDVIRYYKGRYVPENMVLAIGGDITAAEALEKAAKTFEKFERRPLAEVKYPEEPKKVGKRYAEREANIQMAILNMGFRTTDMFHPDMVKTDMLSAIMGVGKTSRLNRRLVEEKQLVQTVGSGNYTPHYVHGHLSIYAQLDPANLDAVQKEVMAIAEDLKTNLVSVEDLDRARNFIRAAHLLYRQTSADQVEALADNILATGDPLYEEKYFAAMDAVTPEQIREMAKKYLNEDNLTTVVLKPFSKPPAPEGLPPVEVKEKESGIEKYQLKNGLTVLLKRNPELPLVSMQTYSRGGALYDGEKPGISNFMVNMLMRGTATKSADDINLAVENMGAQLSVISGNNTFGLDMTVLKGDVQAGISLFADVLLHPAFADAEVERVRPQLLFQIQNMNNDWGNEISSLFRGVRFGDHPYSRTKLGTAESVSKIASGDLKAFHDKLCVGSNMALAVFGDIDIEKTKAMIDAAFGEMPAGEKDNRRIPPPPAIGADTKGVAEPVVVQVPRQQVNVMLATNGIAIGDAADAEMELLTLMLSQNLERALRGRNDYVYLAYAYNIPGFDTGTVQILAQTKPEKYDAMMKEIRVEIDKMKNGEFTDEEFENIKRQAICFAEMGLQTNASQADVAALNELYGIGYDYATKYPVKLSKVTREDMMKLVARCFGEWMVVETRPGAAPPEAPGEAPAP
jgi:zinc protease